mmetsp:Transcript_12581/g.20772  ORF Transcript_12581/g.20772 Transcript_12581/m.20772 type:complete len:92 (+) Transcript_12581:1325-1600(+)
MGLNNLAMHDEMMNMLVTHIVHRLAAYQPSLQTTLEFFCFFGEFNALAPWSRFMYSGITDGARELRNVWHGMERKIFDLRLSSYPNTRLCF